MSTRRKLKWSNSLKLCVLFLIGGTGKALVKKYNFCKDLNDGKQEAV